MANCCSNCNHCEKDECSLIGGGYKVRPDGLCPGYIPKVSTNDLGFEVWDDDSPQQVVIEEKKPEPVKKAVAKTATKKYRIEPMLVKHDPNRPDLVPFGHQKAAIERYEHENIIPLFFEMGCGKSFTTLQIAQKKFLNGETDYLILTFNCEEV